MQNREALAAAGPMKERTIAARWPWHSAVSFLLLAVAMGTGSQYHGNGVNMPLLVYVMLALIGAVLVALPATLRSGHVWREHPLLFGALALYLLLCSVNVFVSQAAEISFLHWWMRASLPFAALVAMHLVVSQRSGYGSLLWLVTGVCVIGAGWGIVEFLGAPQRINGPFVDPNNLAMLSAFGFLLLLPRALAPAAPWGRREALLRVAVWVALAMLVFTIFATFSRAVILLWGATLVPIAAVRWWRRESIGEALAALALGVASYVITISLAPVASGRYTRGGDLTLGWDVRLAMWRSTMRMWWEHPWLGSGIGTFRVFYPGYREVLDQFTGGNTPHNDFVNLLFEGGPLMLAFLLLAVGAVLVVGGGLLRAALRRAPDLDWQRVCIALALGAVLAHASINFVSILELWQILLGCGLALLFGRYTVRPAAPLLDGPRAPRLVTALCGVALLLPFRALVVDAVSYGVILSQPGVPFAGVIRNDGEMYLKAMALLEDLAPTRGLPPYGEAYYLNLLALRVPPPVAKQFALNAARAYQKSLDEFPYTLRVIVSSAQLYMTPVLLDLSRAERIARLAVARDPTDLTGMIVLNDVLVRQGREHEAYVALREHVLPWGVLNIVRYPLESEAALKQLQKWSQKYGEGPSAATLQPLLARATRTANAARAAMRSRQAARAAVKGS